MQQKNKHNNYFQFIFHDFIPGFGITVLLALVYLFNLLWIISYEVALPSLMKFFTLYIAIYVIFLIILNMISSLFARFIFLSAQCLKGAGNYAQSRLAVLYSLVALLPVNILSCVLQFTFQQSNPDEWAVLKVIAYIGIFASLILGFIVLVRNIVKFHRINILYAFISVVIAGTILALIAQFLFMLRHL